MLRGAVRFVAAFSRRLVPRRLRPPALPPPPLPPLCPPRWALADVRDVRGQVSNIARTAAAGLAFSEMGEALLPAPVRHMCLAFAADEQVSLHGREDLGGGSCAVAGAGSTNRRRRAGAGGEVERVGRFSLLQRRSGMGRVFPSPARCSSSPRFKLAWSRGLPSLIFSFSPAKVVDPATGASQSVAPSVDEVTAFAAAALNSDETVAQIQKVAAPLLLAFQGAEAQGEGPLEVKPRQTDGAHAVRR